MIYVEFIKDLQRKLASDKFSINETVRLQHSGDESYHAKSLPEVVVFPETSEEVSFVIQLAKKHNQSITPFGVASSLEGSAIPYESTVVIDFSKMNKIIEVKKEDFLVRVQPGVTLSKLNKELKKIGMFFPIDPGADATLGGMSATNASGTMSVRYGTMRDQVRDMEVVLANGTIIHSGNLASKSASGYNLNGILVGSEGTLGCFTELTLQITGVPEKIIAARATFTDVDSAAESVMAIMQSGISIARVELVDKESIKHINWFNNTRYSELDTLFIEFHGNKAGLNQDVEFIKEIIVDYNCLNIEFESETAGRNKLWEARHNVLYSYVHGHPGKKLMITDVCLPVSELAQAVKDARIIIKDSKLTGGIVGHVGDGNYHIFLMIDIKKELNKANEVNEHIVNYAISKGGTCTGEHGVGIGKRKYQEKEHGKSFAVMYSIKNAIDPSNIFNPGKIF